MQKATSARGLTADVAENISVEDYKNRKLLSNQKLVNPWVCVYKNETVLRIWRSLGADST